MPVCGMARPLYAEGEVLLQLLSLCAARLGCIIAEMLQVVIFLLPPLSLSCSRVAVPSSWYLAFVMLLCPNCAASLLPCCLAFVVLLCLCCAALLLSCGLASVMLPCSFVLACFCCVALSVSYWLTSVMLPCICPAAWLGCRAALPL